MDGITVILTTYRRPHALLPQIEAVRAQMVVPGPGVGLGQRAHRRHGELGPAGANPDRVVRGRSTNALFHARFGLALTAPTEYVAVFDDDAVPGPGWFANCLETMRRTPGILGTAGVRLRGEAYQGRSVHGWAAPLARGSRWTCRARLVLRTEWVRHLFSAPPVLGTNGEDIELAALAALRLSGVRCYCPPHPPGDRNLWGSLRGEELGGDEAARFPPRNPPGRARPGGTGGDRGRPAATLPAGTPHSCNRPPGSRRSGARRRRPEGRHGARHSRPGAGVGRERARSRPGSPPAGGGTQGMPAPTGLRAGPGRRGGTSRCAGTPITFGSATPTGSCRRAGAIRLRPLRRPRRVRDAAGLLCRARGSIRAGTWSPGLPTCATTGSSTPCWTESGGWPPRPRTTRSYFSCAAKSRSSVTEPAS